MERHITVPVAKEEIQDLRAGDYVYLTGVIYTARDAAHKRMDEVLSEGKELPLDIKNQMIYYMGPSPAREGRPIGSAGPTTASRMDKYAPRLLDLGLGGMIGKGKRSQAVQDAIVRNKAVYFAMASITSLDLFPFPIIAFSPRSINLGAYLSIRVAVVGPADPITFPSLAGDGPI